MLLNKHIPFFYIFERIKVEFWLVTVYMAGIGLIDEGHIFKSISIPLAIPSILGTAISLILGFRTNQAYSRWWEARQVWGAIVNDSRSFVRQLLSFTADIPDGEAKTAFIQRLSFRQIAFCYALGDALRGLDPLQKIKSLLSDEDILFLEQHQNKHNALLLLNGRDLKSALAEKRLNAYQQVQLDETINKLCDSMGKCERIKNTVFPATYSLVVHLFIYLFVIFLPFGLVDFLGYVEIPLVVAIATMFFYIEKTAIIMQDPFENRPSDTAVSSISRTIEINIKQMLKYDTVPEKWEADDYYIM
ncbi:bestrophin family ion channel [Limibacter armeniacum]|uniref:bestrophin family protein n=1 Tax=Limibacter armeniacum TaxID=466084 RepID=UPI002FE5365F